MSVVTVETTSRSETSSLLRKLRAHHVYAIQVERSRWLVRSPVRTSGDGVELIEELVAEWAREEGMSAPAVRIEDGPAASR
jgi:hypothetical protein